MSIILPFASRETPVPASPCPHCGYRIDQDHSGWKEGRDLPEVGDLTICAKCGHILRFGRRLILNALTDRDERRILDLDKPTRDRVNAIRRQPDLTMIPLA